MINRSKHCALYVLRVYVTYVLRIYIWICNIQKQRVIIEENH